MFSLSLFSHTRVWHPFYVIVNKALLLLLSTKLCKCYCYCYFFIVNKALLGRAWLAVSHWGGARSHQVVFFDRPTQLIRILDFHLWTDKCKIHLWTEKCKILLLFCQVDWGDGKGPSGCSICPSSPGEHCSLLSAHCSLSRWYKHNTIDTFHMLFLFNVLFDDEWWMLVSGIMLFVDT